MRWLDRIFGLRQPIGGCTTDDFVVVLDASWTPQHQDTHYGFARNGDSEHVTISAQRAKRPLDQPTLLVAALDFVRIRQQAFQSISGGTTSFSELETSDAAGGMDLAFVVADAAEQIQSKVWVLARPNRIVTVSFNRYPPLLPTPAFLQLATDVRSAVTVK
jgi:hypothetical protein